MYNIDSFNIDNNTEIMSTACVSAFYDVGDVLYQNRKNNQLKTQYSAERRATIGATMGNNVRNRNFSTGSFIPTPPPSTGVNITQCVITNMNAEFQTREHRKLDRSLSEPVGDKNLNNLNNQRNQNNINSSRYKTELCRPFEEMGHCKYGDKCQFAHGFHELRTLNRHPKYKTELCRTYHTIGFCPYGPRCHFVHNDEDKPASETSQQTTGNTQIPPQSQPILSRQSPPLVQPQVKRPSTINFNSSFSGSLGSVADSPPSSLSNSPSLSPTFVGDDIYGLSSCTGSQLSGSSSSSSSPVFNFSSSEFGSHIASLLKPLNVQTSQIANNSTTTVDINTLQQQFNAILNLNQRNNNHVVFGDMEVMGGAPSPPDSISGDSTSSINSIQSSCGSPLDISKSLRLPIFNRLSHD